MTPGTKLGPYEIVSPLGAGGMGEVWKARDTRLDRIVAIKIAKEQFSERFEREARLIASLNHPHICTLYDVGPNYLVMEYIEGVPIKGPLPFDQALRYAVEICEALEDAHRKLIIHRDLKPANIMVNKAGVKVLDFGLAKIRHKVKPEGQTLGPTLTMGPTQEGAILGTLQYMPPEQAEGQEADARSDIFSFGAVLYEMLTGRKAFEGKSAASILASVMKGEPAAMPELTGSLDPVLRRCLAKDPEERWQSASDLKWALDNLREPKPQAAPPVPRHQWIAWAITAVLAVVAGWALWPKPVPPANVTRFQIPLPENATFGQYVSLSPDGRKLVFQTTGSQGGLWIRDLDALESRRLPGTDGARSPFWSPDSRFVAFSTGNALKKIDVSGGPPQTVCEPSDTVGSGAWSPDGVIIFGSSLGGPMWRVSEAGGVPTALTVVDTARRESLHSLPSLLPDGKHFLYLRLGSPEVRGIYAGSVDAKPVEQSRERIPAGRFAVSYADGYLFFIRENTLMAQPFDASRLQLKGEPVPVAEQVDIAGATGIFSVSPRVLAYRTAGVQGAGFQSTWFDRQGKVLGTFGQPGTDRGFALSPDGTRAAVRDAAPGRNGDLWTLDFARGVRTRLTFHPSLGSLPIWSPDGSQIVFAAGTGLDTLYQKASSGAGEEKEMLKRPSEVKVPTSWSRDGRFLLYYTALVPKTGEDLWVLPLEGNRKPVLLLGTQFNESEAVFSPDERWIAYTSNESGRNEIYVRPFTASGAPSFGEGKWQVSKDGGTFPRWRADGKELIFRSPNGSPMAVEVKTSGSAFEAAVPERLFAAPPNVGDWDVTADGKRFLMAVPPAQQSTQTPITVVLNWRALLKK